MKLYFESIEQGKPYMLRNDGKILPCGMIHPYLIFDPSDNIQSSLDYLFSENYSSLVWFYKNSSKPKTKENIRQLCIEYWILRLNSDKLEKGPLENLVGNFTELDSIHLIDEELIDLYRLCDNETNQEFCRFRTSALKLGRENDGIYFRISSVGFNWFNLIWETVYKLKAQVSDVTICTDTQAKGGKLQFYSHSGKQINRMPVEEFITLSGNPIIESFTSNIQEDLYKGLTLDETFELHPRKINLFVSNAWKNQLLRYFK